MKNLKTISLLLFALFCWTSPLMSQWSPGTLDDLTYRIGDVGVGTDSPKARVEINSRRSGAVITDGGGPVIGIALLTPVIPAHLRLSTEYYGDGQVQNPQTWDIDATSSLNFKYVENSGASTAMSLNKYGLSVQGNNLTIGSYSNMKLKTGLAQSLYGEQAFHIGFGLNSGYSPNGGNGTFFEFPSSSGGSVIQGDVNGNMLFITKPDNGQPYIGTGQNMDYTGMIITGNQDVLIGTNETMEHPNGGDYKLFVRGGMVSRDVKVENKVIIGTNETPEFPDSQYDYKLVVNGGILSKEMKVRSDFADYVFEKDYPLLSLKEVEKHIQEKGHLHNTPSAKEIQTNGLNVGEITTNQQEKIEELFLHMIAMEKRINELEKENNQLKEKNSDK